VSSIRPAPRARSSSKRPRGAEGADGLGNALTGPYAVAAAVLCVAGLAKLRTPASASRALAGLGLPAGPSVIRAYAVLEIGLGAWALISPAPLASALLAFVYAAFTGLALLLWRRAESCGCFGAEGAPATPLQAVLSALFAALCATAIGASPHGLGWALGRPLGSAAVLVLGTAAAAYGTVLAYSELPQAWRSWSPQ
jgi:hypothetical protein